MNILEEIVQYKKTEVLDRKSTIPFRTLEKSTFFNNSTLALTDHLIAEDLTGIIAEFKRKSPSKGIINNRSSIQEVTHGYQSNGASGLSILTDEKYFGGSSEDLVTARKHTNIPILRKDFMIDEYQIVEAKSMGADVILLIAACLSEKEIYSLARFAHSLNLQVLMEVHDQEELHFCNEYLDIVGVNNRNLKTFEVNINLSVNLSNQIPPGLVKISESGISQVDHIKKLKDAGFQGYLIGENFMKESDPVKAFAEFMQLMES